MPVYVAEFCFSPVAEPKDSIYLLDNIPHDWLFLQCKAVVRVKCVFLSFQICSLQSHPKYDNKPNQPGPDQIYNANFCLVLLALSFRMLVLLKILYYLAGIFLSFYPFLLGASWWCWNNSCGSQSCGNSFIAYCINGAYVPFNWLLVHWDPCCFSNIVSDNCCTFFR